ncbi:MAG: RecX family transcriptional regulator [Alistipes putredinis]|nr:MAG: RecX family transcriptional regulator [Alistipes putredinis]
MPKVGNEKTPQQALSSLMRLCSRSEKCISDARRLMRRWGISDADADAVIRKLTGERFIDEYRYAAAYVRDKMSLSGWGVHKIRAALAAKGVERGAIEQALSLLDAQADGRRLLVRMERKLKSLSSGTAYEKRTKIIRYGLSLGFDYEDVIGAADIICKDEKG